MRGNRAIPPFRLHFSGYIMRTTLRVFIISVLVLGLVLGSVVRSASVQSNAVATLRRAGAAVFYEWEPKDAKRNRTGAPAAPNWLVDLIGVDFFGGVRTVQIDHGTQEALMPSVGELTSLQKLDLFSSPVTDPDLRYLRGLHRLRELSLSDTEIGDGGLAHLSKLSKLERLNLMRTRITVAGLLHLKRLASIRDLSLDGTNVGDAGLAHLKDLKTLDSLSLGDASVNGPGLVYLAELPRLTGLYLRANSITDDGLVVAGGP